MDELRCKIELRAEGDSPGRLVGTLLTYGERANDRAEVFEPHALTWPDGGIVLRRQHSRAAPIMRATPIERDGAVVFDEPLPDTVRREGRSRRNTLADCLPDCRWSFEPAHSGMSPVCAVSPRLCSRVPVWSTVRASAGPVWNSDTGGAGAVRCGCDEIWPWARTEVRESNYTDQVISQHTWRAHPGRVTASATRRHRGQRPGFGGDLAFGLRHRHALPTLRLQG